MKEESKKEFLSAVNSIIKNGSESGYIKTDDVSDGYHTFGELYEHRITLFIALCKEIQDSTEYAIHQRTARGFSVAGIDPQVVWRSRKHSDGEMAFDGLWFLLGINQKKGKQITYHLPISKWDECEFAQELETAPEWDGHTSEDVLKRLKEL